LAVCRGIQELSDQDHGFLPALYCMSVPAKIELTVAISICTLSRLNNIQNRDPLWCIVVLF